jgi:hypothetical protein
VERGHRLLLRDHRHGRLLAGADYVDLLGIDGYNRAGLPGEPWVEFASVIGNLYTRLCALHPTAPVWWCEGASGEDGSHDKGEWVDAMFTSTAFPPPDRAVNHTESHALGADWWHAQVE